MRHSLKLGALLGASIAALMSNAAYAQSTAASDDEAANEDIIVTGTNIRGQEVIGGQVDVLGAADIAETGRATVSELMRELPANFAGGVANGDNNRGGQDTSSAQSNLTGGSGVNLRGLGALSTLVLVDGRRVAASGQFGDFIDISNIPVNSIQRIDILKDGASAVYGSDAVGGVVNIITRRRIDGLNLLARIGTTTEGGGTEFQASAAWGTDWGSGHVALGYEYNRRNRVGADERDFNGGNFSDRGGVNWPIYTNRAGRSANIFAANPAFNGAVAFTVPGGAGTGLTVAQLTPAVGGFGNSFDPWEDVDILPESERHSAFLNFDQDITDGFALSGGLRFTQRSADYRTGYLPIFASVPTTNPAFIAGTSNNFGVLLDDILPRRRGDVRSYAGDIGFTYDVFGDWVVEGRFSHSRENQRRRSNLLRDTNIGERLSTGAFAPSSLVCSLSGLNPTNIGSIAAPTPAQTFCAARNYATFNPYSTQPLSQQIIDQLVGYEDLRFRSQLSQVSLIADGTLFEGPGGPVRLAIGSDVRRETIDGTLDFNYRSINPLVIPYGRTQQRFLSFFGELAAPIVSDGPDGMHSLDLSAAVRYERSEGLGEFSTVDPRFGIRWEPIEGMTFSGSWGTSFHAPPQRFQYDGPQPVPGGNAIFYANAFYTAPCNTTLVQLNGFTGTPGAATGNCTFTGMVVAGGAGPTLRPERAETWTLGVNIEPPTAPGLRIGISYFNLNIKDRLVRISAGTLGGILANYFATGSSPFITNLNFAPNLATTTALFNDPRFTGLAGPGPTRTPGQIQAIIYATQINLASLNMDGLDLNASYDFNIDGVGDVGLYFNGTLVTSYDVRGTPTGPTQDKLGLYETTGNPVPFRSRQGIRLNSGNFSFNLAANYVSGYECAAGCYVPSATGAPVLNTVPVEIGSWTTIDFQASYSLAGFGEALADSNITFNVLNLFNERPPFIDTGRVATGNAPEPYDASNATIIGRTVSLTLTTRF
jgi:iron complex outermembrane recepter protein